MTAGWGTGVSLGYRGIEQKGKRSHGHGQQCGDYWQKGKGSRSLCKNTIKKKENLKM